MTIKILTQEQLNRVIKIGKVLWSAFTEDERDTYYNEEGTISFFENVLYVLNLSDYTADLNQMIQFEEALAEVEIESEQTSGHEYLLHINLCLRDRLTDEDVSNLCDTIRKEFVGRIVPDGVDIPLTEAL